MARVAICLYGLSQSLSDKVSINSENMTTNNKLSQTLITLSSFDSYEKNLDIGDNYDVFFHTWGEKNDLLLEKIKPKKYSFENQKEFTPSASVNSRYEEFLTPSLRKSDPNRLRNIYSRWYSTLKSLEIKKEYELENEFKYDFVLLNRFDVTLHRVLNFQGLAEGFFYVSNWYSPSLSTNRFIRSLYYKTGIVLPVLRYHKPEIHGLKDFWFYGNSEDMDSFSKLYEKLNDYLMHVKFSNHHLAYHHLKEINLSNKMCYCFNDTRDYSLTRVLK